MKFLACFAPLVMVQLTLFCQYVSAKVMAKPIFWWENNSCTKRQRNTNIFKILRIFLWLQHHYIGARWLAAPIYSFCLSKWKWKQEFSKMAAKLKDKRTSITNVRQEPNIYHLPASTSFSLVTTFKLRFEIYTVLLKFYDGPAAKSITSSSRFCNE